MNIFTQKELFTGQICPDLVQKELKRMRQNLTPHPEEDSRKTIFNSISWLEDSARENPELLESVKKMDDYVYLFSEFLQQEFSLRYEELIPTIEYVAPYAGGIKYEYKMPNAFRLPSHILKSKKINLKILSDIKSLFVYNSSGTAFVKWLKKRKLQI